MKPFLLYADEPAERAPLLDERLSLHELLAGLAARMSADQRYAFCEKMAQMDRQRVGLPCDSDGTESITGTPRCLR